MSDADLLALAETAGVSARWKDAFGVMQDVAPDTLRAVLRALDLPAGSDGEIRDSQAALHEQESSAAMLPLMTGVAGRETRLGLPVGRFRLTLEDGGMVEGEARHEDGFSILPAIDIPGYHQLELADSTVTLAVAPQRCLAVRDVCHGPHARPWGLALQLYSLRRHGDGGIGDFEALSAFVRSAAGHGAAAVAISPVHAQFSADVDRFSPYSPSSRVMLNVLHAALPPGDDAERAALEGLDLIDWATAARFRLGMLRRIFDRGQDRAALAAYREAQGDVLERHARFEALHTHLFGEDVGRWHWRDWPDGFRDPENHAVQQFADAHAADVAFHAWLQWRADQGLAEAQAAARAAGMPIGLISDLAVGTDSGGSHAWSRQDEMLIGLNVGAPPDLLSPGGQDWGLMAFSSRGLRQHGYGAFIEMLRGALRHAGGVRIDHVMALSRLWVLPEGSEANAGAYLRFPEQDLLRLVALESHRHRAVVLGEDLGTVPEGYTDRLRDAGVMGMRVLWFERGTEAFTPPSHWTPDAVAMTTTHDLPTVAGWWRNGDLDWRAKIDQMRDEDAERAARVQDRGLLWQAFRDSGAAEGDPPPIDDPAPVVDAAVGHVGRAACDLVLLPVEDAIGLLEQPNLPGTLDQHPNWRRRLPDTADRVLDAPATAARLATLNESRR